MMIIGRKIFILVLNNFILVQKNFILVQKNFILVRKISFFVWKNFILVRKYDNEVISVEQSFSRCLPLKAGGHLQDDSHSVTVIIPVTSGLFVKLSNCLFNHFLSNFVSPSVGTPMAIQSPSTCINLQWNGPVLPPG